MPLSHNVYQHGKIHHYSQHLIAYEFISPSAVSISRPNFLIFIGGLGDTLFSTPYAHALSQRLLLTWHLVQIQLSSSGKGWGTSSLAQDAKEIGELVKQLRNLQGSPDPPDKPGKIVLLGHSTGCQDCVTYANEREKWLAASDVSPSEVEEAEGDGEAKCPFPKVDGLILQAPVSDREGLELMFPASAFTEPNRIAKRWLSEGRGGDVLPFSLIQEINFSGAPVTAERWLSITSPGPEHAGADDMFSSDLSDERLQATWGKMGKGQKVLILYGDEDRYVPPFVDKERLVKKWVGFLDRGGTAVDGGSGVVKEADHTLSERCGEGGRNDVFARILRFLENV